MQNNPDKKVKKRKVRIVQIEDGPIVPPGEMPEITIDKLETSIQDMLNVLEHFIQNPPKVVLGSIEAKEEFNNISEIITDLKNSIIELDKNIQKEKKLFPFKEAILLLKDKEQIVKNIAIHTHPRMVWLEEREKEAYPPQLNETLFKEINKKIATRVTGLQDQYRMKKSEPTDTEISNTMLTHLNNVLKDIDEIIGKELQKVNQEYRYDPKTFNADRYAVMINAKNNLAVLEERFAKIMNSFDDKVAFEKKTKVASDHVSELTTAYHQIFRIQNTYSVHPLIITLKNLLVNTDGSPKITFNPEEFKVSLDSPLSSQALLDTKAAEIQTTYKAMVDAIKSNQLDFNPFKEDIKFLSDRSIVFDAISNTRPLDFKRLNDAVHHDFDSQSPRNAFLLFDLIVFADRRVEIKPQMALFQQSVNELEHRFPELTIDHNKQTLTLQGKEYPLPTDEYPLDFGYRNARNILLTAIKEGDAPNINYRSIYSNLLSAQTSLENYIRRQNVVSEKKEQIDTLITAINIEVNKPPVATDKAFHDKYRMMHTDLTTLRSTVANKTTRELAKSIKELSNEFEQYQSLQKKYSGQLKQLDEIIKLFNPVLVGIMKESDRIKAKTKTDPRLKLLDGIRTSVQSHRESFNSLRDELITSSNNINDSSQIRPMVQKIQTKLKGVEKEIKGIITDEQLKEISLAKRNPFMAWLAKLIRPILSYFNRDRPERPGFFVTKTEQELKSLRENLFSAHPDKSPDRENIDPKQPKP